MCNSRDVVDFTGPIKEITTKGFGQNSAEVVAFILNRADGEKKGMRAQGFSDARTTSFHCDQRAFDRRIFQWQRRDHFGADHPE